MRRQNCNICRADIITQRLEDLLMRIPWYPQDRGFWGTICLHIATTILLWGVIHAALAFTIGNSITVRNATHFGTELVAGL